MNIITDKESLIAKIEFATACRRTAAVHYDKLKFEENQLRLQLAELLWGIKINVVVRNPEGNRFQVSRIAPSFWGKDKPVVYGKPFKKDGSLSQVHERYLSNSWTVEGQ